MFTITNSQLRKLDQIPQSIFLIKLEKFIVENLKEEIKHIPNLNQVIKKYFIEAQENNLKQEKEIVKFIVSKLLS